MEIQLPLTRGIWAVRGGPIELLSSRKKINTCLISVWMTIFRAQVEVQPRCEKWST
ncbi:hypothetical protein Mapa_018897 [Marchantia paleacea]|nr:hypothetical protein Mapa_018897 [Marchantia paleacea]